MPSPSLGGLKVCEIPSLEEGRGEGLAMPYTRPLSTEERKDELLPQVSTTYNQKPEGCQVQSLHARKCRKQFKARPPDYP